MQSNEVYYVYAHVDPKTDEYVYIGHGNGARAYMFKTTKSTREGKYGHRSKIHSDYLEGLIQQGLVPHEWVYFIARGLSKKDAIDHEREMIRLFRPKFNQKPGCPLKMSIDQIVEAEKLRISGWSYSRLAHKYGVSTMTVHRTLNIKDTIYAR